MSSVYNHADLNGLTQDNITTRRSATNGKAKVAVPNVSDWGGDFGSLHIEDILSQDEARDVITMLDRANELGGTYSLPSFISSTQMNGRDPRRKPDSPPLSPVPFPGVTDGVTNDMSNLSLLLPGDPTCQLSERDLNSKNRANSMHVSTEEGNSEQQPGSKGLKDTMLIDLASCAVIDPVGDPAVTGAADPVNIEDGDLLTHCRVPLTDDVQIKTITESRVSGGGPVYTAGDDGSIDGSEAYSDTNSMNGDVQSAGNVGDTSEMADPEIVAAKMKLMENMLALLDSKSVRLETTVRNLEDSLEFSQKEITDLKKENGNLRQVIGNLEIEDKRTQFQVKDVADKLDRLDSITKKRNLLFDGIPESDGRREVTEKLICEILDHLSINKEINFEACYRVGPYSKVRPRAVLVTFERQTDRDMVYAKRMELNRSSAHAKVWINEDVSPTSKRKREVIRLISREAQQQGIDCRTGKYAIHIDRTKFDENNFDELPCPLQPASLKQVRIDDNTLAYQSEHAPLSNFFPSQIVIGKHRFFCVEQAFQFLRAKSLNKPLAATRIYLSRDVRFIKQTGQDLGTSEAWETQQYDYMYICLKKKFEQNPDLRTILLNTGKMELVEATPDRTWGCGATLSSNVLRQHSWSGQNKHGKILMTVRDELRQTTPN